MCRLKVALFVEGGEYPYVRERPLERLWNDTLASALGIPPFHQIHPISKKHLVSMNPDIPRSIEAGESFDQILVRKLNHDPFDAALVAWDLVPAWEPAGDYCRLNETIDLYRFLGRSPVLPNPWRDKAQRRFKELTNRAAQPGGQYRPPILEYGTIVGVCMEPMFESLLVQDERSVKRALQVTQTPRDWPTRGWGDPHERQPDQRVLAPAVLSVRRMRPVPQYVSQVRGDMKTNKDGWDEYILRKLVQDPRGRVFIANHPLSLRLKDLLIPAHRITHTPPR